MCDKCGCGLPGDHPAEVSAAHAHEHEHGGMKHSHPHTHDSEHTHTHDHDHEHGHGHGHSHIHTDPHATAHAHSNDDPVIDSRRTLEIRQAILAKNDRLAERNRGFFEGRRLLAINVLSSPGSGKTTLLRETIKALGSELRSGVIVGDLATDNDAQRLREAGAPVVQVTTGTVCHLEAEMVSRAARP